MQRKFKLLEQKYMETLIRDLDKISPLNALGTFTSAAELGEMYFILPTSMRKHEPIEPKPAEWRSFFEAEKKETPPVKYLINVIQEYPKIVLTGEPGAGKTTSLLYISVLLIVHYSKCRSISIPAIDPAAFESVLKGKPFGEIPYIPVYISLKNNANRILKAERLIDIVIQKVKGDSSKEDIEIIVKEWHDKGRLWLLLDGLDELSGEERRHFLKLFHEYYKYAPKDRITLSSRPAGEPYSDICISKNPADDWKLHPFDLLPLTNNADSIKFSALWLKKLKAKDPEGEAAKLINCPQVKGIIKALRNPMLLRMLIHIYFINNYKTDELPTSRMQLYERYIKEVLLVNADLTSIADDEGEYNQMMQLLEHIAWIMHSKNEPIHTESQYKVVDSFCSEKKDRKYWFNIFTKMRILFEYANDDKTNHYSFSHRSYQEYLVTRRLLSIYRSGKKGNRWVFKEVIEKVSWSSHYTEIILMFLRERSMELHADGKITQADKLFKILPPDSTIELFDLLNERILDPVKLLFSKDKEVIEIAIRSIEYTKDVSAVQALIVILNQEDMHLQICTAKALGKIGDSSAVPDLLEKLNDNYKLLRMAAAEALGIIGDSSLVLSFIIKLNDNNKTVRITAAEALGQIGDSSAVPELIGKLNDDCEYMRMAAAEALGKIQNTNNSIVVRALIEKLNDYNENVQVMAAEALGQIGDSSAVHGMIENLNDKTNNKVRVAIVEALGEIGSSIAVPALIDKLNDCYEFMRMAIAKALGKIGDTVAVPSLIDLLDDNSGYVRGVAADALGKIGDSSARPALISKINDDDDLVRRLVAISLGRIGGSSDIPTLNIMLMDKDWGTRKVAAEALGRIGDSSAIPSLLATLMDKDWAVRMGASIALQMLGDSSTVPALLAVKNRFIFGNIFAKFIHCKLEDELSIEIFKRNQVNNSPFGLSRIILNYMNVIPELPDPSIFSKWDKMVSEPQILVWQKVVSSVIPAVVGVMVSFIWKSISKDDICTNYSFWCNFITSDLLRTLVLISLLIIIPVLFKEISNKWK